MVVMAWNLWHTAADARDEADQAHPRADPEAIPEPVPAGPGAAAGPGLNRMGLRYEHWEKIEKHAGLLAVLIAVMVSFGGLAEITPLFVEAQTVQPAPGVEPYEPLRLAGRDIYVREGCYLCHSQMIRTLRFETQRYGPYSTPRNPCTTARSSGARSARVRISRASAASTPTTGSGCTCSRRASSCPSRTCRTTRGSRKRRSTAPTSQARMRVLRTARRSVHRCGDRRCGGRGQGQDRARRAGRVPAGAGSQCRRCDCRGKP